MGVVLRNKLLIFGVLTIITFGFLYFLFLDITNPSSITRRQTGAIKLNEGDFDVFFFSFFFMLLAIFWVLIMYQYKTEQKEEEVEKWLEERYGAPIKKPELTLLNDLDFAGRLIRGDNTVEDVIRIEKNGGEIHTFTLITVIKTSKGRQEIFNRVFLMRCTCFGHHTIMPRLKGLLSLMNYAEQFVFGFEGMKPVEFVDDFGNNFNVFSNNPNEIKNKASLKFQQLLLLNHDSWPFVSKNPMASIEIADGKIALLCEPPRNVENMEKGMDIIERLSIAIAES